MSAFGTIPVFYMCTTHVLKHYQPWIPDNLSCNETPPCMSLTTWHNCVKSHTNLKLIMKINDQVSPDLLLSPWNGSP